MAGYQPRVQVTDERHNPLTNVRVEAYDVDTGAVVSNAETQKTGIALFGVVDKDRNVWFRISSARSQAGKNRFGHARITLLPDTVDDIPPIPADSNS